MVKLDPPTVGPQVDMVTGAFSYTGKYIARRLLLMGKEVRTLTTQAGRKNSLSDYIKAYPFSFDNPGELVERLRGVTTFYNTYWLRFPQRGLTFDTAVENTKKLIRAAEEAGVRRIVHVSITNASEDSPFPYFRGKRRVENTIIHSKLSYAVIRPTVIFGPEGILINNIAWLLRRFPVFTVFGSGDYQIQPVFVEDVAEIAVRVGQRNDNIVMDAIGPEIYTFNELIRLIANKIRSKAKIVHVRPAIALFLAKVIGFAIRDVIITKDEMDGLMSDLLVSQDRPTGITRLSDWLDQNADKVGVKYAHALERHYRWAMSPS